MTFNKAPWAVDGARSTSALARKATYATGGGRSGIVKPGDLRVLSLAVPGPGLRISAGSALVLNRYLNNPGEAYVVANPDTHTVLSMDMPAPVAQTRFYLVTVVVGDPEFNQTGHPYMPTTIAPEDAADFEYVRIVMIPCNANTTTFEQLGLQFPGYALARLEVPPNTSTITQAMIVDLRKLSQARSERVLRMGVPAAGAVVQGSDYINVSSFQPVIDVPPWANRIDVIAHMTGLVVFGEINGDMRVIAGPVTGGESSFDIDGDPLGSRENFIATAGGYVGDYAGGQISLLFQGRRTGHLGRVEVYPGAQMLYDVQFSETTV